MLYFLKEEPVQAREIPCCRDANEQRVLVPKDWGSYAKKCGLMIKPVHRSPLCPVEMEMQHAQRLIVPLYSPSHSNISSTGLIIPAAGRGVNNNKKQVLKLLKDGLACYFQGCVIFSRRAASFGWGRRRRSSHLIWTGFPRRYLICIIFFVYGDALVRGSSLVSAWYWWRIT